MKYPFIALPFTDVYPETACSFDDFTKQQKALMPLFSPWTKAEKEMIRVVRLRNFVDVIDRAFEHLGICCTLLGESDLSIREVYLREMNRLNRICPKTQVTRDRVFPTNIAIVEGNWKRDKKLDEHCKISMRWLQKGLVWSDIIRGDIEIGLEVILGGILHSCKDEECSSPEVFGPYDVY